MKKGVGGGGFGVYDRVAVRCATFPHGNFV